MDTRFRIYTEDVNRESILQQMDKHFDAYTVTLGIGMWKGLSESSLIIEVLGSHADTGSIHTVAKWIKVGNNQENVLVTREIISAQLI